MWLSPDDLPTAYLLGTNIRAEAQFAERLLSIASGVVDYNSDVGPDDEIVYLMAHHGWTVRALNSPRLRQIIDRLDRSIETDGLQPDRDGNGIWIELNILHDVVNVLRGFLEVYETRRIFLRPPTAWLLTYLKIAINDTEDSLVAEAHHGRHYHYCDRKGRRTDILLTFDCQNMENPLPLFWERHGEGKTTARGKPETWKSPKRENVHRAAYTDLKGRDRLGFRRPSKKSTAVWPMGATLSEHR